jgi:S-adenosylmethionine:tRNA ribosyltransferase-isomerase
LIAQQALAARSEARLLVIDRKRQKISHDHFFNISRYLPEKSLVVLNNSKVIPARLFGFKERSGGKVEIFLLRKINGPLYQVLLRPTSKIKEGDIIRFDNSVLKAEIVSVTERQVRFIGGEVVQELEKIGHMPLPPYIKRPDAKADREDYQTVYARHPGSVAAPTAGLHFTKETLAGIRQAGHPILSVTLHVNYATFKPVEEENILEHKMHTERYSVSANTWTRLLKAKKQKQPIVAVGTTACRVIETVAANGKITDESDLFIYPGYHFQMTDCLITNFHLPKSTLLMLVYAFGGVALMKRAYQEAIEEKYRFFSYGDGMIVV